MLVADVLDGTPTQLQSAAEAAQLRTAEQMPPGGESAADVLLLHRGIRAGVRQDSLVRWLHGQGQKSLAEDHEDTAEGHRLPPALPGLWTQGA